MLLTNFKGGLKNLRLHTILKHNINIGVLLVFLLSFSFVYSETNEGLSNSEETEQISDSTVQRNSVAEKQSTFSGKTFVSDQTTIHISEGTHISGVDELMGDGVKLVYAKPKEKRYPKIHQIKAEEVVIAQNVRVHISEPIPPTKPKNLKSQVSKDLISIGNYVSISSVMPVVVKSHKLVALNQESKIYFPENIEGLSINERLFVSAESLYTSSLLLRGPPASLI